MNIQQFIHLDETRKQELLKSGKVKKKDFFSYDNIITTYDFGSFWVDAYFFDGKFGSCRAYCKKSKSLNDKINQTTSKKLLYLKSNPSKALILFCSSIPLKLSEIVAILKILKENKQAIVNVFRALEVNKFVTESPPLLCSIRLLKLKLLIKEHESKNDEESILELLEEEQDFFLDFQLANKNYVKTKEFIESAKLLSNNLSYWISGQDFDSWDVDFLFSRFEFRHFESLAINSKFIWTIEVLEKYYNKISYLTWRDLSKSRFVDWNKEILLKFRSKWWWDEISKNTWINFNDDLVQTFREEWKKRSFSGNCGLNLLKNPSVKWTAALLNYYMADKELVWCVRYEHLKNFTENKGVIWSESFFEIKNWPNMEGTLATYLSIEIPWTFKMINKYKDEINWKSFCGRKDIPLSIVIENFKGYIDWEALSANPYIKWNIRLVNEYFLNINFKALSRNQGAFWNFEFLSHFKEDLDWGEISLNNGIIWDEYMIEYFEDYLMFPLVITNIIWSKQLVNKYGYRLNNTPAFYAGKPCHDCNYEYNYYLPSIIRPEVHFTTEFLKKSLPAWEANWKSFKDACKKNHHDVPENLIEVEGKFFDLNNKIWPALSRNSFLTEDIILHFKPFWYYGSLTDNPCVPWSIHLIVELNEFLKESYLEFWTGNPIRNIFLNVISSQILHTVILPEISKNHLTDS